MREKFLFRKVLNCGIVDYNHNGRKNKVEIELNLRDVGENKIEFTASGTVWKENHSDCIIGGQCIDEIAKLFPENKKIQRINEIWKRWHLNTFHAGCIHQRSFEAEPYEKHEGAHCDICNYTYGHSWIYEEIPKEIIEEIKSF